MSRNVARVVSACVPRRYGRYRYFMEVRMRESPAPALAVVMKNPSTASFERSDPTAGKVEAWARAHGFGCVRYVNLFARRSPYPEELNACKYPAMVGRENDAWIERAVARADLVVAAWGNPNGIEPARYARRIAEVARLLAGVRLHAVGPPTMRGHPRHGLGWNGGCALRAL